MILLYLIIFLTPIVLFAVWKIFKINRYWRSQGILEVEPWPIIGNMWSFLAGQHFGEWIQDIYNKYDERYFGVYHFLQPALLIKDVDLIKQIVIKDFDTFVDHKNFFTESQEPVFKDNVFNLKGNQWRAMRATLSPAFTSSKMKIMFNLMRDCAEQFTDYFVANSKPNEPTVLTMKEVYSRYTNDVIATCGFGITCDSLKERNNAFFLRGKDVGNFGGIRAIKFILYTAIPDVMNFLKIRLYSNDLINFFRNLLTTTVDLREKGNIYRPDMIHLLMEARKGRLKHEESTDDNKDTGFAIVQESKYGTDSSYSKSELSDDEFAAQIMVFFVAGFETSSSTLMFMSHELAVNDDIQRKLQKEIDEYMQECNGQVHYEGVLKLKYLDMVITETLRLWSSVFYINRVCSKPYTIPAVKSGEKDIELKANDLVWIPTYPIQRDPNYYPNPTKFDPERFNDENKKNINPYSYMPFGIGPRNCIGSRFALLEIKILMVHLLSKFDLVVVKETSIPPKVHKTAQLMGTEDGVKLGFNLRNK